MIVSIEKFQIRRESEFECFLCAGVVGFARVGFKNYPETEKYIENNTLYYQKRGSDIFFERCEIEQYIF